MAAPEYPEPITQGLATVDHLGTLLTADIKIEEKPIQEIVKEYVSATIYFEFPKIYSILQQQPVILQSAQPVLQKINKSLTEESARSRLNNSQRLLSGALQQVEKLVDSTTHNLDSDTQKKLFVDLLLRHIGQYLDELQSPPDLKTTVIEILTQKLNDIDKSWYYIPDPADDSEQVVYGNPTSFTPGVEVFPGFRLLMPGVLLYTNPWTFDQIVNPELLKSFLRSKLPGPLRFRMPTIVSGDLNQMIEDGEIGNYNPVRIKAGFTQLPGFLKRTVLDLVRLYSPEQLEKITFSYVKSDTGDAPKLEVSFSSAGESTLIYSVKATGKVKGPFMEDAYEYSFSDAPHINMDIITAVKAQMEPDRDTLVYPDSQSVHSAPTAVVTDHDFSYLSTELDLDPEKAEATIAEIIKRLDGPDPTGDSLAFAAEIYSNAGINKVIAFLMAYFVHDGLEIARTLGGGVSDTERESIESNFEKMQLIFDILCKQEASMSTPKKKLNTPANLRIFVGFLIAKLIKKIEKEIPEEYILNKNKESLRMVQAKIFPAVEKYFKRTERRIGKDAALVAKRTFTEGGFGLAHYLQQAGYPIEPNPNL